MKLKIIITILFIAGLEFTSAVNIIPKVASLTARGAPLKISYQENQSENITLKVSNQLVLNENNEVTCNLLFDINNCHAWVVALDSKTGATDTCKISIVPWTSNLSSLTPIQILHGYQIIGKSIDTTYVYYKNYIYKTIGDLSKLEPLGPISFTDTYYLWGYLNTPAGSFIRNNKDIYFSKDERNWHFDYHTLGKSLRNGFDFKYDSITKTTSIFTADYLPTGEDTARCSVYRKIISPTTTVEWTKTFSFFSQNEWYKDKSLFPAARHIHTIVTDPYTGHIWLGTGDDAQLSHIYYSDDNGTTWKHIGMGSQEWRVLSIWFTKKFIYWTMDSPENQKIFRISRLVLEQNGFWPDMTPKLTSGFTQKNVNYIIASSKDQKYYFYKGGPASVGDIIWGSANYNIKIDEENALYPINDPKYDYREVVSSLPNSALWGNTAVYDDKGDKITLIPTDAEGASIDMLIRVFGIKERLDGSVDVQELICSDQITTSVSRFYAGIQDAVGDIYFQPTLMKGYEYNDLIKTRFKWNDNSNSKGGELINEADSTKYVRLKLLKYEGNIIEWQQANNNFEWKKLNVDLKDTLSIIRDKDKIKYIRAIVKKDDFNPVASKYLKVNSIEQNNTRVITSVIDDSKFFSCYPNPAKNKIYIHLNNDSSKNFKIELFTISGIKLLNQQYNFFTGYDFELPILNFPIGTYLLKITTDNKVGIRSIIIL